jgi:hypothetical protein
MENVSNADLLRSMTEQFAKVEDRFMRVETTLGIVVSKLFKVETQLHDVDERTRLFPRLYDNVDKLMSEIKENRHERAFINSRLTTLEKNYRLMDKRIK